MNKGLLSLFLAGMLMLASGAVLQADPVSFLDVHDPADVFLSAANPSYSFTHDITDDGFNPATDVLDFALLSIFIRDDSDVFAAEYGHAVIDGVSTPSTEVDTTVYFLFGGSFSILSSLQADGKLVVDIVRESGDFYFEGSSVVARGERTASVPEPATLTLVGLGMIGAAALSRRRRTIK